MKIPRIKLQWGGARQQPGNWYFGLLGFYERKSGGRSRGLAISLRGALAWGAVAAAALYFAAAGYFWWKQDRRAYNYVRYTDVLQWPLSAAKRQEVSELQGQAIIAEGLDDLKNNQWSTALRKLQFGLSKYPRANPARLKLAQIYIAYRLRVKAQETLLGGIAGEYPGRPYLESAIAVVAAGEDYEMVIEICDRALALFDPARHPAADRRWLIEQRIQALLAEQRNDDALAYAEQMAGEVDENMLTERRLLALLQARRNDEAVAFAEAWRERKGNDAQVLRLLARTYREAGRADEMAATLNDLIRRYPADPRVRVFAIVQNMLAGRDVEGRVMIDDFIFRFGGTPANFALLAEPLAEIRRRTAVETVIAAASERGVRDPRLPGALLQVMIAEQSWPEALRQLDTVRATLKPDALSRAVLLELYQMLIGAASNAGEGPQATLVDYVAARQLPMSAYRQCIEVLRKAGRTATARRIVQLAEGVFPDNNYLVGMRKELESSLVAAREAAEAARLARPESAPDFASAATFYAALEEREKTSGAASAVTFLRDLRTDRPAWLAGEEEPLGLREMQIHSRAGDLVGLQGAIRRYMSTDRIRIQNTLALARESFEGGRRDEARLILDEVLRRIPNQPVATELKAKWFPPPKPKPAAPAGEPAASGPAAAPATQ